VDGIDQTRLPGHLVDDADAAATKPSRAIGDFIVNVAGGEHRPGAWPPVAIAQSCGDPPLASEHFFLCSSVHSKRLLAYKVDGILRPALYARNKAFRVFLFDYFRKLTGLRLIKG